MTPPIGTYLLCLFSLVCPTPHRYATRRVRIPIFYKTSVDPYHYTPFIHGYINADKQLISLRLDTGSPITVIKYQALTVEERHREVKSQNIPIRLIALGSIVHTKALIASKNWGGSSIIGQPFFQSQSTVLFTKNMLYLNFFPDGLKGCGHFEYISSYNNDLPVRGHHKDNTELFFINIKNSRLKAMFDSGTSELLLHTSLSNDEKNKKIYAYLYNGRKAVEVQYNTVNVFIKYNNKGKANYNIHIHDPHVMSMNSSIFTESGPPTIKYILGWPLISTSVYYYVNHRLKQQCFIAKRRLVKLLRTQER